MTNNGETNIPQSEPQSSDAPKPPPVEIDQLLADHAQRSIRPDRETRQK